MTKRIMNSLIGKISILIILVIGAFCLFLKTNKRNVQAATYLVSVNGEFYTSVDTAWDDALILALNGTVVNIALYSDLTLGESYWKNGTTLNVPNDGMVTFDLRGHCINLNDKQMNCLFRVYDNATLKLISSKNEISYSGAYNEDGLWVLGNGSVSYQGALITGGKFDTFGFVQIRDGGTFYSENINYIGNRNITLNSTLEYGGIITAFNTSTVSISNAKICSNISNRGMSLLYCQDNCNITFENVDINDNIISNDGDNVPGMMYLYGRNTTIKMIDSRIINNSSNKTTGSLINNNGYNHVYFTNCEIVDEKYDQYAIYNADFQLNLYLYDTVLSGFYGTTSAIYSVGLLNIYGNGFYDYNGDSSKPLSKMSGTIVKNFNEKLENVSVDGPSFIEVLKNDSHMEGINFCDNQSGNYLINLNYWAYDVNGVSISACNFVNNKVKNIFSIKAYSEKEFKMNDCIIINNTTETGAIYARSSEDGKLIYELTGLTIIKGNTPYNFYLDTNNNKVYFSGSLDLGSEFHYYNENLNDTSSIKELTVSSNVGDYKKSCYLCDNSGYEFSILLSSSRKFKLKIYKVELSNDRTISYSGATNLGNENFDNNSLPVLRGIFKFSSMIDRDEAATYYYSDGYFVNESTTYNASLSTFSLGLTMSGNGCNVESEKDNVRYQYQYWYALMKEIGFNNLYVNDAMREKPNADSYGVMIGSKNVTISNTNYTIIQVNVRNDGEEIANVIKTGNSSEHVAISNKAQCIYDEVNQYIDKLGLRNKVNNGTIKFWVTGYSYGGSIANIVSKLLIDVYQEKHNDIYGYCFANMASGSTGKLVNDRNYNGIHNVVLGDDLFAEIFNSNNFNYIRYGVMHYLPTNGMDSETYNSLFSNLYRSLWALDHGMDVNTSIDFYKFNFTSQATSLDTLLVSADGISLTPYEYIVGLITKLNQWGGFNKNEIQTTRKLSSTVYPSLEEAIYNFLIYFEGLSQIRQMKVLDNICSFYTTLSEEHKTKYNESFITSWDNATTGYKVGFLKNMWNYACLDDVKKTSINCYCSDEEEATLKASFYTIVMALLDFYVEDANNGTVEAGTLLATLVGNYKTFIFNHSAEFHFAWLRALDSRYDAKNEYNDSHIILDTSSYTPTIPQLYSGDSALELSSSASSFTNYSVHGNDKEMLIYSIYCEGTNETYEVRDVLYFDLFELYSLYGDDCSKFYVEVYSYLMGKKSEVQVYQIDINALELDGISSSDVTTTYDGNSHSIIVNTSNKSEGAQVTYRSETESEFTDSATYINVGTRTIYYRVYKKGYKLVTRSQQLTIEKCVLGELVPLKTEYVYNGESQKYFGDSLYYTFINNEAMNAGTTKVTVKLSDPTNYCFFDKTIDDKEFTFEIKKANYDMSQAQWNYTSPIQYDGKEKNVEIELLNLPQGIQFIQFDGQTRATNVGTYQASIQLSYDNDNYNDPTPAALTWIIKPYEVQITWPEDDFIYNGMAQKVYATYFDVNGLIHEVEVTFDKEFKDLGLYTGSIQISNPNYLIVGDSLKTYQMKKANISDATVLTSELYYNGSEQTLKINQVSINGCLATYTIKEGTDKATNYSATGYDLVLVGTGNFEGEKVHHFNVNPYSITILWDENDFVYNGEVQTVTATFADWNNQIQNLVVSMNKEFKNAGTYTATVSLSDGTENYTLPLENTKEYIMNKLSFEKLVDSSKEYYYTGKIQTFIPDGYDSKWMSIYGNKQQEVSEIDYAVTIKLVDTVNCEWSDHSIGDISIKFKINKQRLLIPTEGKTIFTYTGYSQTYCPLGFDDKTMSIENNKQTNINKNGYDVTVEISDKTHYCWNDGSDDAITFKFVILDAQDVVISKTDLENGVDIEAILKRVKLNEDAIIKTAIGELLINKSAVIDLQDSAKIMKVNFKEDGYNTTITILFFNDKNEEINSVNGKITFTLNYVQSNIENAKAVFYYINQNNQKTEYSAKFNENTVVFTFNQMGTYLISYQSTDVDPDDIEPDTPDNPIIDEPSDNSGCGCDKGINAIQTLFILPFMVIPFGFRLMKHKKEED